MPLEYIHVDVFSRHPYGGNSLPVFLDSRGLSTAQMLQITKELRHFEAIYLEPTDGRGCVRARVFDLFEELPFAGHPVIGAAAALHHSSGHAQRRDWRLELPSKTVTITTERTSTGYFGMLDQGRPEFLGSAVSAAWIPQAFGLRPSDMHPTLPPEVVSTGLRYFISHVAPPVLMKARIAR